MSYGYISSLAFAFNIIDIQCYVSLNLLALGFNHCGKIGNIHYTSVTCIDGLHAPVLVTSQEKCLG